MLLVDSARIRLDAYHYSHHHHYHYQIIKLTCKIFFNPALLCVIIDAFYLYYSIRAFRD